MKSSHHLNKFTEKHIKLIRSANGIVDDIFVLKTGVMITQRSSITPAAAALFEDLNIDTDRPAYEQHGEFNSRLTYLSFAEKKGNSAVYNEKMIKEYGHRSVYNGEYVTFLIAGCAIETMLEFVAHNEASIARLTSSKTNAQNYPLFKLLGANQDLINKQKKIIYKLLEERFLLEEDERKDKEKNEIWNMMAPGNKVASFTITMSIKNWHKTLIGRLSIHGVESDMIIVLKEIATQLKMEYSLFFNTVEEYFEMGNNVKYEV